MKVTLKDVANMAGVSIKSVSRVVNNQGEIGEETKIRILDAINQLGYRPNQLARGLITGRTQAIGVIIPDITDPFFPEIILGAETAASERGYNVFLCNANREPALELKYVDLLSQRQVDGLIIAGSRLDKDGLMRAVKGQCTVILTPNSIPEATTFTIDEYHGGLQIGEHLLSLGHRQIGYIEGGWSKSNNPQSRQFGLIKSFQDADISHGVKTISIDMVTVDNARQAAKDLLEENRTITALVGYNDVVALGILQACRDLNLQVPKDISVIGFDDIPEAARHSPSLTSFHIDRLKLGSDMMQVLMSEIEKETGDHARIMVSGQLITRQSSATASR